MPETTLTSTERALVVAEMEKYPAGVDPDCWGFGPMGEQEWNGAINMLEPPAPTRFEWGTLNKYG